MDSVTYAYPSNDDRTGYAVKGLSLTIPDGKFVCVLGPSGCGKTTTLHVLAGLAVPEAGTVRVGDEVLCAGGQASEVADTRFGYLFQDGRLLPWRSVAQNIELAMRAFGVWGPDSPESMSLLLESVGMKGFANAWPQQLSGGQRQRVALARSLAIGPDVLLMDEPFGTLDEVTARVLRSKLLDIWHSSGRTVVFVTHSIREAVFLADTVFVLSDGPGTLLKAIDVPLPRPREYGAALGQVEADVTDYVLDKWRQFRE